MSWLKNAVSKAVEAGNKNNITRTVRNYADSVVQQAGQAVVGGAKLFQERIVARNYKSYKDTVRRLEEAAVSCRGPERVHLLRRWLVLLKEIENVSEGSLEDKPETLEQHLASDETKENTKKASVVLYYDPDEQSEPVNFLAVFLHSQALEGIVLSMILEAPDDEEVALLLQMFEFCLTGAKEVHLAIVSSIQDLAKVFCDYEEEVLVKREELLQFAQSAISGLKINADLLRIDTEASSLRKKLDEMRMWPQLSSEGSENASKDTTAAAIEALKESLAHIRICSRLEGLLLKKQLLHNGDTLEIHAQRVDKLKVLSESLANSSDKAEKRILDTRSQKDEALKFRVTKESEVSEIEKLDHEQVCFLQQSSLQSHASLPVPTLPRPCSKLEILQEIGAEIAGLEKQRDLLEAELKRVNISLVAAQKRLQNAREEKDQFDEANMQIVKHLSTKEDELLRSIDSCRVEGAVIKTWINFLDDTWTLQRSYTETKEKKARDELEKHADYFVNLAISLLSGYRKELEPSISRIRNFVENLKTLSKGVEMIPKEVSEDPKLPNPRKNLEEEYLDYEAKIITTFSVVDNIREQFYAQQQGKSARKDDPKVKELLDDIEKLRKEFEAIERPVLDIECPPSMAPESPRSQGQNQEEVIPESIKEATEAPKSGGKESLKASADSTKEQVLEPGSELAKLESEFGKVNQEYTEDEINGWEFDELERELKASST